jgi:hypothetical protein
LPSTGITSTIEAPQCLHRSLEQDRPILQFDAAPAVTSNPFSVNGNQFPSRNREMLGDMREGARGIARVLSRISQPSRPRSTIPKPKQANQTSNGHHQRMPVSAIASPQPN